MALRSAKVILTATAQATRRSSAQLTEATATHLNSPPFVFIISTIYETKLKRRYIS